MRANLQTIRSAFLVAALAVLLIGDTSWAQGRGGAVRGGGAPRVGGAAAGGPNRYGGELQRGTFAPGGMGRGGVGFGGNGFAGNWWGNTGWGGWGCYPNWGYGGSSWYPGLLSYTLWPVTGLLNNNGLYGWPSLYGGYGYGGSPQTVYVPQQQIYVERVVPSAAQGPAPAGAQPAAPANPTVAPEAQPPAATDIPRRRAVTGEDFYLNRPGGSESVKRAVDDIRRAWLNGDFNRLKDRVVVDASIRIYPKGKFAYALSGGEFRTLTKDAMASIETIAFDVEAPRPPENDSVFVTGKHSFKVTNSATGMKEDHQVFVSYRLTLKDGAWRIVAAGSGQEPIRVHED